MNCRCNTSNCVHAFNRAARRAAQIAAEEEPARRDVADDVGRAESRRREEHARVAQCAAGIRGIAHADCDLPVGHGGAHEYRHEAGGVTRWNDPEEAT